MEEKKGNKFGVIFLILAVLVLLIVVIFVLYNFGVFKSSSKVNPPASKTGATIQSLPIYQNSPGVSDVRAIYVFNGKVSKIEQAPGGYNVTLEGATQPYFMPGQFDVNVISVGKQISAKTSEVKAGDTVTFSAVYDINSNQWLKTFTAADLKLLQQSR